MSVLDDNEMEKMAENDLNIEMPRQFNEQLNTDIIKKGDYVKNTDLTLQSDKDGLALIGNNQLLRGDFTRMRSRITPGNLNRELLIKASKIKGKAEGFQRLTLQRDWERMPSCWQRQAFPCGFMNGIP